MFGGARSKRKRPAWGLNSDFRSSSTSATSLEFMTQLDILYVQFWFDFSSFGRLTGCVVFFFFLPVINVVSQNINKLVS